MGFRNTDPRLASAATILGGESGEWVAGRKRQHYGSQSRRWRSALLLGPGIHLSSVRQRKVGKALKDHSLRSTVICSCPG